MKRKIFFYKGKRYEMTDDEIEAGYYFRQRQNLYEDAKRHLLTFVFEDDPDNVSPSDQMTAIYAFEYKYGMELAEAFSLLDKMVSRFEENYNCDFDENSTWQTAISEVLRESKRS